MVLILLGVQYFRSDNLEKWKPSAGSGQNPKILYTIGSVNIWAAMHVFEYGLGSFLDAQILRIPLWYIYGPMDLYSRCSIKSRFNSISPTPFSMTNIHVLRWLHLGQNLVRACPDNIESLQRLLHGREPIQDGSVLFCFALLAVSMLQYMLASLLQHAHTKLLDCPRLSFRG